MQYHDNLGLKLHALEFQANACGSNSWTNPNQSLGQPGTEQKPTYCCSECPTLQEKFKSGNPGPFRLVS